MRAVLLILAVGILLLAFPRLAPATSLRFHGNGTGGIDRVKIRIDGPATPADIGSGDFTLEWWMRALPGENASNAVACNTNDGWIHGNIVFDRDVFDDGEHGDYGVSLTGGRVAFGVSAGAAGNTICGDIVVADGEWHHVAVTRQRSNGQLRIYVDGVLDAEGDGGVGSDKDVSYQDGRATAHPGSDPFLVIGAEKHDAGPSFPSYHGWIDEVRLSTIRRYTGPRFTRPFTAFTQDGNTAALYHLDEGAGDAIGDAVGGSPGTRAFGGSPAGPEWSNDAAPLDTARRVALEQVIGGLTRPVTIANAGDDRLFVVEADGRILAYQVTDDVPFAFVSTYLDIRDRVECCSERGLLGLAFHPNFASNRYFFVFYTRKGTGGALGDLVIARYRAPSASSNLVDPGTERILLTIEHSEFSNHNGGGIAFGPDGRLYVPVGDGGSGGDPHGNGQNTAAHLGKILRLAVDVSDGGGSAPYYSIPSGNPFAGGSGLQKEVWALGLRNPWRISFDRVAGDLFIGDVGQEDREEIDFLLAGSAGGANFGWSRMEGFECYSSGCSSPSFTPPILDYNHDEGCSVTGGYRYRGDGIPTLNGVYVFGDYCRGTIWGAAQASNGAWSRSQILASGFKISTFGEDAAGELYVVHLTGGTVHRFVRTQARLTVTKSGNGTGTVTGPGLSCGANCSLSFGPGDVVNLTAAPGAGSWLAGWGGACGGTGGCSVVMDGDRSVTATFNLRSVFQFSAPSYSVSEGSGSVTITVQRLTSTGGTATVDYKIEGGTATAGVDFTGSLNGTLTFTPGQSTRTFSIPIANDAKVEGPETILLSLHAPTGGGLLGAQPTAVVTITDNDAAGVIQFSQATYSTSESNGSFNVPVQRSGGSGEATVTWTISGSAVPAGAHVLPNLVTGTLTFGANATSVPIPLALFRQGDTLADGSRTVQLTLSNPQPAGAATLGAKSTATLTITDNDSGGTLQFSPTALTVSEAADPVALTVTRNQKAAGVKVDWAIVAQGTTAVHGTDYDGPTSGQLQFAADVLSQTIPIHLLNPPGAQGSRTLRVQLSNVQGGATLGSQKIATLTITDDEVGLQFSQASYTASEGSSSITIPVVRTGPGGAVSVGFTAGSPGSGVAATASASATTCTTGADYLPVAGTLNFGAGDMTKTFTVQLCKDGVVDPAPKVVGLVLSSPQPAGAHLGPRSAVDLTINNVDAGGVLKWSSSTYSVNESAGKVLLTASRSGGSAGNVTVDYVIAGGSATAGTDFTGPNGGPLTGTLTFAAGVMSQALEIPIVKQDGIEPNEKFTVTLQNQHGGATVGSPGVATVTIVDSDRTGTVQFGQATATAQEFAQSVSLNVTRTGSTSGAAQVNYQITGATALVVPADLAGTVHFDPGQGTKSLVIHLQQESSLNGNSALTVTLKAPLTGGLALGTPNPATVTLIDDEGTVQFGAATFTASEGNGSATITLTRTGGTAKAATVTFATGGVGDSATPAATPGSCSLGADYRPISNGSLTFNPGQTSRTFSVQLCGDVVVETPNPETLTLRLLSVTPPATLGAQSTAVLQIQENDGGGTLRFSSSAYSLTEGTGTATLTVLRTGGSAGGVSVPWHLGGSAVAGTDYVTPPSVPIPFGSGQTSASLQIQILNDSLVDGTKTLVVTLDLPSGGATLGTPSAATLSINDNEPSVRFSSATYNVNESGTGVGVTVVRGGSTGTTVTLNVKTTGTGNAEGGAGPCGPGIDFTTATLPVTFNPGDTSKTVTIPLCPDTVVDGLETVGLVLDNVAGATLGTPNIATIQIAENDVGGTVQFAAAAKSVMEPGVETDVEVLVSRTGGSASGVTAHWQIAGGTAVPGVDYTGATSGTVTFGLNDMSEAFKIKVKPRAGLQGPRSIQLLLDTAGSGGSLGAQTIATLWILDAD